MTRLEEKHPLAIRWFHWVGFPLLLLMVWSGLLVYWANDAYFSARNLAPTFDQSRVDSTTRRNGDVGLGEDFDMARWVLGVQGPGNAVTLRVTMAQIR
jgi:hypothetical protein